MKINKKHILVIVLLGLSVLLAFTVNVVTPSETMVNKLLNQNSDKKWIYPAYIIKQGVLIENVPQAVKSAVISKYAAYVIHQVYEEENDVYKLVLKNDQLRLIAYYTADGEYLRQEIVKPVQMVKL